MIGTVIFKVETAPGVSQEAILAQADGEAEELQNWANEVAEFCTDCLSEEED